MKTHGLNSENNNKTHDYAVVLRVLSIVFVEIRIAQSIIKANDLSDVFHNVPMSIYSLKSEEEIIEKIILNARRRKCEEYVLSLLLSCGYVSEGK